MRNSVFRFKKFDCRHGRSSMKIGVDAVLLGAWADVSGCRIIDVGTGCGVIALMCAQRNQTAFIDAVDIDPESVSEAAENFGLSPWPGRLSARRADFTRIERVKYDLIISNPPYFDAGVSAPETAREKARHQSALSPSVLLRLGKGLLTDEGRISMIVPSDQVSGLRVLAAECGLAVRRLCLVRGHAGAPVKRAMIEFCNGTGNDMPVIDRIGAGVSEECLVLEQACGVPTESHRRLCKDFYLKF